MLEAGNIPLPGLFLAANFAPPIKKGERGAAFHRDNDRLLIDKHW
jgi:hypothetical protein